MPKSDNDLPQIAKTILSDVKQWSKYGRSQIIHEAEDKIYFIRIDNEIAKVEEYCNKNSFDIQMDEISQEFQPTPTLADPQNETQYYSSKKKVKLVLVPNTEKKGNKQQNEVKLKSDRFYLQNRYFYFLYFITWYQLNKEKEGWQKGKKISNELIFEMIGEKTERSYDWQCGDEANEQTRAKSKLKECCNQFEIIILDGGYFKLNTKILLKKRMLKKY